MDYRDWGYDTRVPRERRPDDDVRPDDRGSTGELARYRGDRRAGAHRADDDPDLDPPRIGYATLSEFRSVYRGRRRREDAPADDRPYGRRSARERWRDDEGDARPEVTTAEWTREAYTGEWTREAYTEEWTRASDSTTEWRSAQPDTWDEPRGRRARDEDRTGWRSRERADDWAPPRDSSPAFGIPSSAIPTSSFPSSAVPSSSVPSSSVPSSSVPDRYERPSWAVGRGRTSRDRLDKGSDDSPPRGRRSWQDQIEPRWAAEEESQFETRWTAGEMDDETSVRLSGDDPRWVGIPSSAPRSPAVAYRDEGDFPARVPSPRSAPPSDRGRFDRQRPAPSSYRGRPSLVEVAEDDLLQESELADGERRGTVPAAILATLAWFTVPVLLFAVYTFTIGSANRAQALESLIGSSGRLGAALAFSVIAAVLIRWLSTSWRSVSVGLAAAVVGGGLSTVLLSALSGQPIG